MASDSDSSSAWTDVEYDGSNYEVKIEASAGPYAVGARWGNTLDEERTGIVVLFKNSSVQHVIEIPEPRSIGITAKGRFVIADWIEYGEPTGSIVAVVNAEGDVVFRKSLDYGAVLVDINETGTYIAVSTYESAVRVYSVESGMLVGLHRCEVVDRPVVDFNTDEGPECIQVRDTDQGDPLYAITLDGEIVGESDEAKARRYIHSFDPNGESEWLGAIEAFRTNYCDASDRLRQYIIEKLSDRPLRNVSSERTLEPIIDELENWLETCDRADHRRAIAIRLADAYYRYAKAGKNSTGGQAFWERIETAQHYAEDGLPWYEAKSILAKTHRIQSRTYERLNEPRDAKHHLEQIVQLEAEYDISLMNKTDKTRLENL